MVEYEKAYWSPCFHENRLQTGTRADRRWCEGRLLDDLDFESAVKYKDNARFNKMWVPSSAEDMVAVYQRKDKGIVQSVGKACCSK